MIEKFLEKTEFTSYEDFIENYSVKVPVNFNFAYDIVDEYAKNEPGKKAIVWCNDSGEEKVFTFADMKNTAARQQTTLNPLAFAREIS